MACIETDPQPGSVLHPYDDARQLLEPIANVGALSGGGLQQYSRTTILDAIKDLVERYCKSEKDEVLINLNKNTILSIEKKIQGFMTNNIDKVISHL